MKEVSYIVLNPRSSLQSGQEGVKRQAHYIQMQLASTRKFTSERVSKWCGGRKASRLCNCSQRKFSLRVHEYVDIYYTGYITAKS
jgi:hypothetical protein